MSINYNNDSEFNLDDDPEPEPEQTGFFETRSANECINMAKLLTIPRMLFDQFWIEFELCVLFADTGLGKSILAVQIANSITKGIAIPGFRFNAPKQGVLYFDFELALKQFQMRYSEDYGNEYVFDSSFKRSSINPNFKIPKGETYITLFRDLLEREIIMTGLKCIIIDNMTFLGKENEKAKNAIPLMQSLNELKVKHGLSILILAHTPKRDYSKPITDNDLAGSKNLSNLIDSSFAIGLSATDPGVRYLIQTKVRSSYKVYNSDNVCVCIIEKNINFLLFTFVKNDVESNHLKKLSTKDNDARDQEIVDCHTRKLSLRDIAAKVGCSHQTVSRVLKNHSKIK